MVSQKHLFQLDDRVHYLNCAYMSPLLKSVEESGINGMTLKRNPFLIKTTHFFELAEITKQNIGKLINAPSQNIAIIPSVSYGLASAIANLPLQNGNKAIVVGNEFPSGYNEIKKWCDNHKKELQIIQEPINSNTKGRDWNSAILKNINKNTAAIVISSVHWTDGTKFDLKSIGQKCIENNVVFIVDGTQSVGVATIDVQLYNIDVLVCAAYKWLLGPYSIGFAYFGNRFANGIPLEEAWLNRSNAEDFTKLTQYTNEYKEGSNRYNVGEYSNFILLPMLNTAIEQLLNWGVQNITNYCENISKPLVDFLEKSNYSIEETDYRSKHLFGISLPTSLDLNMLLAALEKNNIYVSVRGNSIRVSIHMFNTSEDINSLKNILEAYEQAS
ncbi:aminotransferase class V-fold PLP-dependent enzyme [Flavobacterium sp.]|uniref:aminotransferase class V-fold PLP-dependent enzyme n=1 Tax=Flavobacterium sp. TaxID=239 RepID=UPI00286A0F88|nr:aminotransferase class V-fold PLP-dependent enzyme [Flavobacterium sp.]